MVFPTLKSVYKKLIQNRDVYPGHNRAQIFFSVVDEALYEIEPYLEAKP